ncbi:hypothetical protein CYMTET_37542 [Cymbomonas tetramitiformis]|uniref:Uncharacterized protein n=1 Tax=Cymbomonas tetramitiformis TaxID=36881 RepID=A0AAE0F6J6_9CHLO|nr:hypothetical protein CYMTET_37542 [Cymbomonas tetramitiformis]
MELQATHACAPTTVRGRGILLGGHARKEMLTYTNGKNVIMRSLKDPMLVDMYTLHAHPATVARYSPNGEWLASGDAAGNLKVWGAYDDHPMKLEHTPFSGSIDDIQWSEDGQRIVCCGDGKETRVKAFMWDSGNAVGEFDGIGKRCNSCDFKPSRPFRIATASEDFKVNFYEGPPFKFKSSNSSHSNYANCVRFSPNGERFMSVGSDKKGILFDGKTGEVVCELPAKENHQGSIYACSWSPDSTKVLTCSADKTCKLWDLAAAAPTCLTTFNFAAKPQVEHMQVGCIWLGDYLVSVSLSGDINYLDPTAGDGPVKVLSAHSKTITAIAATPTGEVYSGSYDGVVNRWQPGQACLGRLAGNGHGGAGVQALAVTGTSLISAGLDDKVLSSPLAAGEFGADAVALAGCPSGMDLAADGELTIFSTNKGLQLMKGPKVLSTTAITFSATSAAISPDGKTVAVGAEDHKVYMYNVDGDALVASGTLEKHRGIVSGVKFSPDNSMLASTDYNREVIVWDAVKQEAKMTQAVYHTARVQCLAWSPNSVHLATGGLDMSIFLWNTSKDAAQRISVERCHRDGVSSLAFINETTLVSGGADAVLRTWKVAPPS